MPAIEFWLAKSTLFILVATGSSWLISITELKNIIPRSTLFAMAIICMLGTSGLTAKQEQTISEISSDLHAMKNRHLTTEQKEKIIAAAQEVCPIEPTINVAANHNDAEAVEYALEFVKTFQSSGCLSELNESWAPVVALSGVHIFVQQQKRENLHIGAQKLHEILNKAEMNIKPIYISSGNTLMKEHPFVLAVGANPRN